MQFYAFNWIEFTYIDSHVNSIYNTLIVGTVE